MIQWVYENAARCQALTQVVVATDSDEIAAVIKQCGGKAILTPAALPTGSDRVAYVADQYPQMDVIINLQGDEPFIKPKMLEQLIAPFANPEPPLMTTLAYPLKMENHNNPRVVKVITDLNHDAIYFSRSGIPYFTNPTTAPVYHHVGLYAFRRDFLMLYRTLPQTPLEKAEALEQLRVLEHGYRIRVCISEERTLEVNTAEELELAQHFHYSE